MLGCHRKKGKERGMQVLLERNMPQREPVPYEPQ
jgi:hypothetical protein